MYMFYIFNSSPNRLSCNLVSCLVRKSKEPVKENVAASPFLQGFDNPTTMDVQISGLPPNMAHGFHIHEYGDTVTDGELNQYLLSP